MSKSKAPNRQPEVIREEILTLLQEFENRLNHNDLRDNVRYLVKCFQQFRQLGISLLDNDPGIQQSARDRILLYFRKYAGQVIQGDELLVISGIQDYPRRIRELRVQFGWPILSGKTIRQIMNEGEFLHTNEKIDTDSYLLIKDEQDERAAFRWNIANEIRKEKSGGKAKIIKYLLKNVGQAVSGDELKYVANDSSEWARRVRELRTEDGWLIRTNLTGRSDLAQGFYILETESQAQPHDRKIPDIVQSEVLERDQFKCVRCGWRREKWIPEDPRKRLELHHILHHAHKGANDSSNLVTLCNVCHDLIHKLDKKNEWSPADFEKWVNKK
jgi:5-methylcytosine-specific restriction endonuclease McrA